MSEHLSSMMISDHLSAWGTSQENNYEEIIEGVRGPPSLLSNSFTSKADDC